MAGKRQASSDLNHDNWDREEEPEDRGTFRTATEEELKNRVIKKAKRKCVSVTGDDASDGNSGSKSVFSVFSGFGKPATTTLSSNSPFSFLSKIPAVAATTSGVVSSITTTTSATPTFSFSGGSSAATTAKSTESSNMSFAFENSAVSVASSTAGIPPPTAGGSSEFSEYYKKLSSLNQAVCEWIKAHVDKNPICILSPIFQDYEKYIKEIETEQKIKPIVTGAPDVVDKSSSVTSVEGLKFSVSSSNNALSTNNTGPTTSEPAAKTNGFNLMTSEAISSFKHPTSITTSFSLSPSTTQSKPAASTTTTPSFSFGNLSNNTNQSTASAKPFSFTPGGTPFSFGTIKPPIVVSDTTNSGVDFNEDDEEPPKNEFKQVVEDDAIYSKKCKVFVKKDGSFVDKGVGTLYLKPVESSAKTQLLVRADTNLGNILVNLILNPSIPTQRMGKNNVMMVCMPTPEVEKPTSILLRVKTCEEADELLENIDKYKK